MSGERLLRIRVTLKGRPVRAYVFKKDVITVGRNPESDIFLDNPGVSRDHCKLELTPHGSYAVEDVGSANGTFINDVIVKRQNILDNDILQVGKFSLWCTYDQDRRRDGPDKRPSPTAHEGTTVLSTTELQEMLETVRQAEEAAVKAGSAEENPSCGKRALTRTAKGLLVLVGLIAFALGSVVGAGAALYLTLSLSP